MTTPPTTSGRRHPELSTRQAELLDRLEQLFLRHGFLHYTLDDLAGLLHCSKSTLYALAPSKEQLAAKVVRHYFRNVTARIEHRLTGILDVRERISAYLSAASDELEPASTEFLDDVAAFEPARSVYETNAAMAAERVHGLIAEGVRSGIFRDVHAAFVAEMVTLAVTEIRRGDILHRTGLTSAQAFAELGRFVLGGLSAPPSPPS